MDEERADYVEDFGLLFDQFGMPRMVGRVLGVLLISTEPDLSAEELAEALKASRGSISSATRSLVQMGLVQRRTRTGERRDYFRVKPGAWDELMRRELESLRTFRQMADRGLGLMSPDEDADSRNRLIEMHEFYAYWEKELPGVLERWEESKMEQESWAR